MATSTRGQLNRANDQEMRHRIRPVEGLIYPEDLGAHFIQFDFHKYHRTEPNANAVKHNQTVIALPIPSNLVEKYDLSYEGVELGLLAGRARDLLAIGIDDPSAAAGEFARSVASGVQDIGKVVSNFGAAARGGDISAAVSSVLRSELGSLALNKLPGAFGQAGSIASGTTVNPQAALKFKDVQTRNHTFTWKFIPESDGESFQIRTIIAAIRKHSAPRAKGMILEYPSECEISIGGTEEGFLYFFKRCMVSSFEVNYAPDNIPAFYRDTGAPVAIQLTLNFTETAPIYRDDLEGLDPESSDYFPTDD